MDESLKNFTKKINSITAPITKLQNSISDIVDNTSFKGTTELLNSYEAALTPIKQYNRSINEQLQEAMKATTLDFGVYKNVINLSRSYKEAIEAFTSPIKQYNRSINEQLQEVMKATTLDFGVYKNAINLSRSYKEAIEAFTSPIQQYNKSINEQLQEAMKATTLDFGVYKNAINLSRSYKEAIEALTGSSYQKALQEINKISEFDIAQELNIEENEILFLTEDEKRERIDKFIVDQMIQLIPKINVEKYKKLSPTTQKFIIIAIVTICSILYFYSSVYFEAFRNLEVERAENNIKTFLENNTTKVDTDIIRKIRKIPQLEKLDLIDKNRHRFISVDGLRVRSKPSIKAQILDYLNQGKIVEIIDKNKNWTKISYPVDDSSIEGWIFTRYTKKFD